MSKLWLVFPVVMYGCESRTIKKAERQRIDAFELSCWRRLLRVPWTTRRSNQSVLKEISTGCSLEGLMLKLKLQYFGLLIRRPESFEKTLVWERLKADSLFSFTFIKRLFSSSSLSAIRVESSAYLSLLMFLPAILIPACASSSPVFLMMYSAYRLNKQGDNLQP